MVPSLNPYDHAFPKMKVTMSDGPLVSVIDAA